MDFLRQWLMSVAACAFLVGLIDRLTPDGTLHALVRFCGGLTLLLCMLQPLAPTESAVFLPDFDALSDERAALEAYYRAEGERSLAAVIAERTGAYIEDKAHALGPELRAEVLVQETDGVMVPYSVVLYGAENAEIAKMLECELGIARERQEWRGEE